MHRTNGAGHVGNLFVNEDPATNRPPTEVPADWLNAVQEEIVNVATMNGEVLEAPGADGFTQMRDAILARIAAMFSGIVTAPQFDADLSLATTEFVQRALGSYRGCETVATNLALNAGHVGKVVRNNGANTITLPLASSVVPGAAIIIANQDGGAPCIVQRAGAENIERNGSGVNSVTLNFGENVTLVATNSSSWTVVNGLGTASLAAAGYQKLPSGLIIQWGSGVTAIGGGVITFPVVFPAVCHGVQITNQVTGSPTNYLGRGAPTTTGFVCWNNANTAGTGFDWFAVGH